MEFQKIAENLIRFIGVMSEVNKLKEELCLSLGNDLRKLFTAFGSDSEIVEEDRLRNLFQQSAEVLLSRRKYANGFLLEDLTNYLHPSKLINRPALLASNTLQTFRNILQTQFQLTNNLAHFLKDSDWHKWFSEVDFFNNGYIDASALFQFLTHYDHKSECFEESQCAMLLKLIKNGKSFEKIFFQDIQEYISRVCLKENESQHFNLNSKNMTLELPEKVSNKSQGEKTGRADKQKIEWLIKQYKIDLNLERNERIPIQQLNPTCQQRLIQVHPRNEHYINRVKAHLSSLGPFQSIWADSHLHNQVAEDSKEIVYRLQSLGHIYQLIKQQIQFLIQNNPKFTFINGFNVIDVNQTNAVTASQFQEFLFESDIQVMSKKSLFFFEKISETRKNMKIISFKDYLKIFKLKCLRDEYKRWKERTPLLNEKWSKKMKEDYCEFMKKMIDLTFSLKKQLDLPQTKKEAILNYLQQFTYPDELESIIGMGYKALLAQLCNDKLQISKQDLQIVWFYTI